eukprot:scaffold7359_cov255-Pinguiococcus_pyrenoidosus.AAC.14
MGSSSACWKVEMKLPFGLNPDTPPSRRQLPRASLIMGRHIAVTGLLGLLMCADAFRMPPRAVGRYPEPHAVDIRQLSFFLAPGGAKHAAQIRPLERHFEMPRIAVCQRELDRRAERGAAKTPKNPS